jgi:hypothetical protein
MRFAFAKAVLLVLATASGAAADPVAIGRALFQGITTFAAGQDVTTPHLPAAFVACANCHGARGVGKSEGGTEAPSVQDAALRTQKRGAGAFATDAAILAAIEDGVGRDGRRLAAQMPQYNLNDTEEIALLAYLRRVGTPLDLPPGVLADEIALGTLLPLSGDFAPQGQAILAAMQEVVGATNRGGGIHGRRVTLAFADSRSAGAARALMDLPIYAVIGGMWDARNPEIEGVLAAARIPVLASLVLRDGDAKPGAWVSDLLPPRAVQARLLASAVAACQTAGPRWVIDAAATPPPGIDRVFATGADLSLALNTVTGHGCYGLAIAEIGAVEATGPTGWHRLIGLPFPRRVLESGDARIWASLGRASARIGMEALAASGSTLVERAPLEALAQLNGFEPLPGAPVRFSARRLYAWDPDVLTDSGDEVAQISRSAVEVAAQ